MQAGFSLQSELGSVLRDSLRLATSRAGANPTKAGPSWDCRLQPACMNVESLVTAGQHTAVNTFPGLVHTARHVMEAEND